MRYATSPFGAGFIGITAAAVMALALPPSANAQATGFVPRPLSVRADWLQAQEPLTRNALPSSAVAIAWEGATVGYQLGFLRIARDLSTIEGGTAGVELASRINRFRIALGATGMVGVAMASRDTTGYDFVGAGGGVGHTPKFDYSKSGAKGVGATLSLEYEFFDHLGVRVTAGSWRFSGAPLGSATSRRTIGAGVTVPFGTRTADVRSTP